MLLGKHVKRIFLTGGAGFIGSHIVDWLLKEGYKITVFDNLSNGREEFLEHNSSNPNLKFCKADITNINSIIDNMEGHDLVWHLAANTDIIGGVEKPSRDLNDCVIGTFNVLESMRKLDIKDIIFPLLVQFMETYVLMYQLLKKEDLYCQFLHMQQVRLGVKPLFLLMLIFMELGVGFLDLGM